MSDFPRPMTDDERAVLNFLLRPGDLPAADVLRDQAKHAHVTGLCDCGCPSFGLAPDRSCSHRADAPDVMPYSEAESVTHDPAYGLLLFVNDGWLDYVELVWYGDKPPSEFPPLDMFKPARYDRSRAGAG